MPLGKQRGFTPTPKKQYEFQANKRKFLVRGFTLIEVLIATMLLAMIVGAAALIEKQNLGSGSYNKHKLQATGLAQEGLNLVRSIRDTNLVNSESDVWKDMGESSPVIPPLHYRLDKPAGKWVLNQVNPPTVAEDTFLLDGITYTRKIYIEVP